MQRVRDRQTRLSLQLVGALVGAGLLCIALVLPALGAAVGPTKLENPSVNPRTGTTATLITFSVTYRSVKGSAPEYVRVVVDSSTFPMSASGSDWKQGVVFTVQTTLPVGTASVRFEAKDTEKFVDTAEGGSVTIGQPEPTPTPTPDPTPGPTPTPTPTSAVSGSTGTGSGGGNDSASGSGSGSTSGSGTGATGTGATGAGGTSYTGGDSATGPRRPIDDGRGETGSERGSTGGSSETSSGGPGAIVGLGGATGVRAGSDGHSGTLWSDGGLVGGAAGAVSGTDSTTNGSAGSGSRFVPSYRGPFNGGLAALGLQGPGHIPTTPAVLVSTVAVSTWMAFMLFNKKRRDEQSPAPDEVLHAHAANGTGIAPDSDLAEFPDPEDMMPRWRRPSLLIARKADPIRDPAPVRPAMAFPRQASGIPDDVERRQVRYTVAALLDRPDELRSAQIGEVAAGDELQVEGRSGTFCRIICPDGRQGWIHRTALTEPLGSGLRPWEADDFAHPPDAENALAALLTARGMQRRVV